MTRRPARWAVGGLIAFALGACGGQERDAAADAGSHAAPATVAAPDPCAVVSRAAAEEILGGAVSETTPTEAEIGSREDAGVMRMCEYVTGSGGARRAVLLAVRTAPAYTANPRAYQGYAESMERNLGERPEVMHLSGLGRAALWDATNHTLLARGAGWEVQVQESTIAAEQRLSLETARAFAERMITGMR